MTDQPKSSPSQKAKVQIIMYASALWFVLIAGALLGVPAVATALQLDTATAHLVGGVMLVIAVSDVVIARFLFNSNETK